MNCKVYSDSMKDQIAGKIQDATKERQKIKITNVPLELLKFAWRSPTYLQAFSIWLVLKNESSSGLIKLYKKQLPTLASKYHLRIWTFEKYIQWLIREELLSLVGKDLRLAKYEALKKYSLDIERRVDITYDQIHNVK